MILSEYYNLTLGEFWHREQFIDDNKSGLDMHSKRQGTGVSSKQSTLLKMYLLCINDLVGLFFVFQEKVLYRDVLKEITIAFDIICYYFA